MTMYAEYDFTVNQDFTTVSKNLENGGRSIEYYITLDMAKELSMVERNEKGKHALMIGLRTVLSSMILLKIKTLFAFHKKMKRNGRTVKSVYQYLMNTLYLSVWQKNLLW